MTAITDRMPPVDVEYDSRGKRATKHFEDANEAKRFYAVKMKGGKNPTVKGEGAAAVTADVATPTAASDGAKAGRRKPGVNTPKADAAPPAPAKPTMPGVRPEVKSRAYWAAIVIKRGGGLQAGVTAEMVEEVGRLYGRAPNPTQSKYDLQTAHAALRGWFADEGATASE